MEEEVTQRTIALSIRTAKLNGNVLRVALRKYLAAQHQKGRNPYKQGKQMKQKDKPSIIEKLTHFKEVVAKGKNRERAKEQQKDRGQSL